MSTSENTINDAAISDYMNGSWWQWQYWHYKRRSEEHIPNCETHICSCVVMIRQIVHSLVTFCGRILYILLPLVKNVYQIFLCRSLLARLLFLWQDHSTMDNEDRDMRSKLRLLGGKREPHRNIWWYKQTIDAVSH